MSVRYVTFTRLGKTVKRKLLTREQRRVRRAKFISSMAKHWKREKSAPEAPESVTRGTRRMRRGPGRGGPIITPRDDVMTYLSQGERKYLDVFGNGGVPDPTHKYLYACILLALNSLSET